MIGERTEKISYIIERLSAEGIKVEEEKAEKLLSYYELLEERNRYVNLTAVTDFEDAVEKHFADSLILGKYYEMNSVKTLLDAGSGAGIPGIPLKILYPEICVKTIDAVGKKTAFQNECAEILGLENFISIHDRTEDAARKQEYRESFDMVAARAVANMSTLSEYCLPFVKIGGIFAAYKSDTVDEEIKTAEYAIRVLGGKVETIEKFSIGENKRSLILIRKIKPTPGKYPRKAGLPSKEPMSR